MRREQRVPRSRQVLENIPEAHQVERGRLERMLLTRALDDVEAACPRPLHQMSRWLQSDAVVAEAPRGLDKGAARRADVECSCALARELGREAAQRARETGDSRVVLRVMAVVGRICVAAQNYTLREPRTLVDHAAAEAPNEALSALDAGRRPVKHLRIGYGPPRFVEALAASSVADRA